MCIRYGCDDDQLLTPLPPPAIQHMGAAHLGCAPVTSLSPELGFLLASRLVVKAASGLHSADSACCSRHCSDSLKTEHAHQLDMMVPAVTT